MIKLFIDTTDKNKTIIELDAQGKKSRLEKTSKSHKDQFVLKLIDEILRNNNLTISDVEDVGVNPGPGSFTGIRVGISVANALRFALKLPKKEFTPVYKV